MAETDSTFVGRNNRFRTSRFPGVIEAPVDAATGNVVQGASPLTLAQDQARALSSPAPTNSSLATIPSPPTPQAPSLTDAAVGLAKSGAKSAGSFIGQEAGSEIAQGASVGDALDYGVKSLGAKIGVTSEPFSPAAEQEAAAQAAGVDTATGLAPSSLGAAGGEATGGAGAAVNAAGNAGVFSAPDLTASAAAPASGAASLGSGAGGAATSGAGSTGGEAASGFGGRLSSASNLRVVLPVPASAAPSSA